MNILGLTITRTKAPANLSSPDNRGGWYPLVREGFTGAWQTNTITAPLCDVLTHPTVFACVTLIAGDIKKMRMELVRESEEDVWERAEVAAFSPFLRKPNHFQTWPQFAESWMLSKLIHGNTYVLKERDDRGVVIAGYVLDPLRVCPLIAEDGSVWYELYDDNLSQTHGRVIVPAREIIHDRFNTFFHPLVGISPLYAAGVPAMLGLKIHTNSTTFFANGSQPGGILTAPGPIAKETAERLAEKWERSFGGSNRGKVAVVGDGLKYEPMSESADKSQTNEQWQNASQAIAEAFHVPWYLVGGPMPSYNNVQALNVQYFTQCIQPLVIDFENCLDFGLGLLPDKVNGQRLGTQFNVNDLLWMDSATMMTVIRDGVGAGVLKPNEGRARLNLPPVKGGDTPYLQQQNWSLSDLDARATNPALVAADNAMKPSSNAPPAADAADAEDEPMSAAEEAAAFDVEFSKQLECVL